MTDLCPACTQRGFPWGRMVLAVSEAERVTDLSQRSAAGSEGARRAAGAVLTAVSWAGDSAKGEDLSSSGKQGVYEKEILPVTEGQCCYIMKLSLALHIQRLLFLCPVVSLSEQLGGTHRHWYVLSVKESIAAELRGPTLEWRKPKMRGETSTTCFISIENECFSRCTL